jgi:hypothetical protein
MPIWKPADILDEPEVLLSRWSIYEITCESNPELKTRHFVGQNIREGSGRVSSRIEEFDQKTMKGRTRSGRVYELRGHPGHSGDGAYVWGQWSYINKVITCVDVSREYVNLEME